MLRYFNIHNFEIPEYRSFYIWSFQILYSTRKINILQFDKIIEYFGCSNKFDNETVE